MKHYYVASTHNTLSLKHTKGHIIKHLVTLNKAMLEQPKEIVLGILEVVIMPNGEIISLGKTIGWFKDCKDYLYSITEHEVINADLKLGDKVEYYGPNVSCEADIQRYEQGKCPAVNDERQLVVGEHYEIVAVNKTDSGVRLYFSVRGKGKMKDNIVVNGVSATQFKLIKI